LPFILQDGNWPERISDILPMMEDCHMSDEEQIERWRKDLSGRDPLKFLNALAPVGRSGLPEGVELLEQAGELLPPAFWDQVVNLNHKKVTVREFRDDWLATLRASLPHGFRPAELEEAAPAAFISYSTSDRVRATQLATTIAQATGHHVFLDHWELKPGERLRDRLAASIGKSGALVLLVSKASLASAWVKEEIELAVRRAEDDPRFRIIPVLLESTELPEHLSDLVHIDWRTGGDLDAVAQAVLDRIRGRPSFSMRVNATAMSAKGGTNPYQDHHRRAGRALLPLLASQPELAVETNQLWLLWELFRSVVPNYSCVMRIGNREGSGPAQFDFMDRWLSTRNTIELTSEEIDRGLWSIHIDPARSSRWLASDLQFLGTTGRLSFRSSSNPRTHQNPISTRVPDRMQRIVEEISSALERCEQPARESLVYDLQGLVGESGWRKMELVVGGVYSDMTLAYSSMVKPEPNEKRGGPGVTMELWDPFFGAMKSTELYRSQLTMLWEAEIDLRSDRWETILALA
jgi:hypothetical protein